MGTAALVLVLALIYLASIVILLAVGVRSEGSSSLGEEPVPVSTTPSSSASASAFANTTLEVERARWRGNAAVVEGTWQGDLSSVHCDLLEGSSSGQVTDWWDRSVAARISLSDRTFSQEFVRAGGDVKQPLDPKRVLGDVLGAVFGRVGHGGRDPDKGDALPGEAGPPKPEDGLSGRCATAAGP